MSQRLASWARFVAGAVLLGSLMASSASAGQSYSFQNITNNGNADVSGQVSMLVLTPTDATDLMTYGYGGGIAANQVVFVFFNDVGVASSITQIYWQDGENTSPVTPSALTTFVDRVNGNVNYQNSVGTGNLPGGNSLNPQFDGTFEIRPNNPQPANGINASGDYLSVRFNANVDANAVIAALNNWNYDPSLAVANRWSIDDTTSATLRVGFHVQSIGTSAGSDGYVNIPTAVPEPGTLALAGIGLGAAGLVCFRRRRATA